MTRTSVPPSSRPRSVLRPVRAALVTLVFCLLGAWLVAGWQARSNYVTAKSRFHNLAVRAAESVRERLALYEYGLRAARGTVLAGGFDQLGISGFQLYAASREVDQEFRGARGMGVIKRVPDEWLESYVASVRSDGRPDFAVRQLHAHRDEHFVIQFIEPVERNREAVGLDIGSETTRRVAALAAIETGRATLTGPITLVQATGKPLRSFLLLLPIYRQGRVPEDLAQRRVDAWGWSYAPLVIDEVLADLDLDAELWFGLSDLDDEKVDPFFESGSAPNAPVGLTRKITIAIYGRTWEADLRAKPSFRASLELPDPRTVGATGSVIAALFAGLVFAFVQSRQRAAQVQEEQARRAAIVASSSDAIIGETTDGLVSDWNPGAERMFGYSAAEAIGRSAASLIVPEDRMEEEAMIRGQSARGETVPPFDTVRKARDGGLLDVSVSASPIAGSAGEQLGFAKTIRDIRVAKSAERRALELNLELERMVAERGTLLEAARRDLRNILDAMPSVIGYWDRELKNRFANHAVRDWFGVEPASVPGMTAGELLGARFKESLPFMQAALQGKKQVFESRLENADDGIERNVVTHYIPDLVEDEVRGFYAIEFDITEQTHDRTRLAAALRENEALLSTIYKHAIVSVTDRQGLIIEVNENFCQISQYAREELIGHTHSIVNSGHHDRAFWRKLWGTIGRGRSWRGEVTNRAKDGSLYWVDSMIAPIMGDNGRIERFISIRFDISARKSIELQLAQTHARMVETTTLLQAVLESASEVALIAGDPQLVIKVWNSGAERLLGYTSEEVVGRVTPMLIHDEAEVRARCEELSARVGAPVVGGEAFIHPLVLREPHEWTYIRKDGTRVPVSLTVTEMRNDAGVLSGYLGVARDVTQQKQYEASLREAMQKAEQANQAKSQFLANMSHEIRTPMNAVIGLTFLLGQTALSAEQAEFLSKIEVASKSLLGLINDILDLSKIEARELVLERSVFDLLKLLTDVRDVMKVSADDKGIAFQLDLVADLPRAVHGDATRLRQIVMNLVSNAIKFTERGGVQLRVKHRPLAKGSVELLIEVEDSGIGIPAAQQSRLFAPFAQADASTTRRFGGTGLGLSIVKRLANLMNGEAGLRSVEGVGSTFWVRVVIELAHNAQLAGAGTARATSERRDLAGISVLVVDDSEINLDVARRILELQGARVSLASNGEHALERLRAEPGAYDIVLMDVHMPVLDGREASRRIREELRLTELPIIALTADAQPEERRAALNAGMNDFVTKPFEPAALCACIRRLVTRPAAAVEGPAEALAQPVLAQTEWPAIDGIDIAEAQARLVFDLQLFQRLLSRLLQEFRQLAIPAQASADALEQTAARLHKLRGAAGQLGAKQLCALAAEGERACRRGDGAGAAQLTLQVDEQLAALRASVAAMRAPEPQPEVSLSSPEALDTRMLQDLLELLDAQSFSATARFQALSGQLQAHLAPEDFQSVAQCIESLRFAAAAEQLRAGCADVLMKRASQRPGRAS